MILTTKKKEFDRGNSCTLDEGEYLFVIKQIREPFQGRKDKEAGSNRHWMPVDTICIGQLETPLEPKVGPTLLLSYVPGEGFTPDFIGEGAWQNLCTAIQIGEADAVSSEDFKNAPFSGVVKNAMKGGELVTDQAGNPRKNLRNLSEATKGQIEKVVMPYLQKVSS
jgi:hypothetical protein